MFKLNFFKKRKEEDEGGNLGTEDDNDNKDIEIEEKSVKKSLSVKKSSTGNKKPSDDEGDINLLKISTELNKVKAIIEGFGEVRSTLNQRISELSERIGELRAMILDRDRTIQELELKAVKAADLVETVQPEKLMIEMQKEDAKFEALKANLEGNEAIMDRVMQELNDLRKKFEFFRGVEEVIELSDEIKKDVIEIKKTEAVIGANSEKVQMVYKELRNKYKEADMFIDEVQEFKANLEQQSKNLDSLNSRMLNLADKSEIEKLENKMEHYIESLKQIDRSSALSKDISTLRKLVKDL